MSARNYWDLFKGETKRPKNLLVLNGTDPRPDSNYIPEELSMGIKVELEHTDNKEIAKIIAKDQLDEDPKYYSKMKSDE